MPGSSKTNKLDQLRETKSKLDVALAREESRLSELEKQKTELLSKLKKYGISDDSQINDRTSAIEKEATDLVRKIEEGIPEEYRQ